MNTITFFGFAVGVGVGVGLGGLPTAGAPALTTITTAHAVAATSTVRRVRRPDIAPPPQPVPASRTPRRGVRYVRIHQTVNG
jgi:hypothetical protein